MQILAIDYGTKKIGLAKSAEAKFAEPMYVVRISQGDSLLEKIKKIVDKEAPQLIVFGNPGGKNEEAIKNFVDKLSKVTKIPVKLVDETLTTQDAIDYAIEAGIKKKKRRGMEDAYSATLILQRYLDSLR